MSTPSLRLVVPLSALAALLVLSPACSGTQQRCDAQTCTGCCDPKGECLNGNAQTACGALGAACVACRPYETCTLGQCLVGNAGGGTGTGGGATTGGGTATGGGTGTGGGAATGGGGGTGGGSASGGGAGTGGGVASCTGSNCSGCCSSAGVCEVGTANSACGVAGASCVACGGSATCQRVNANSSIGGRCVTPGTGGGGGTAFCTPSTCPNGCCTANDVCITATTPARCGSGGSSCRACPMGNTCVSGSCTPCAGCIDINTGACLAGTSTSQCGRQGSFCQACDTTAGQSCQSGVCGGGSTCNASTCPNGCCDGNTCVPASSFTNARCGQGTGGAACVNCLPPTSCDATARACVTQDAGVNLDGGFLSICDDVSNPCPGSQCCDSFQGTFGACVDPGQACQYGGTNFTCIFLGGCTCGANKQCQ